MLRSTMLIAGLLACACASGSQSTPASSEIRGTLGVEVVFTDDEIRLIRAYYSSSSDKPAKRGRGKKSLPPGIERNLARGKRLPPGIAKRSLPESLVKNLPPVHPGHERIVIAGKIILVEVATQIVRDVLYDVVLG